VREVGGHAVGLQVLAVKSAQFVTGHAARVKRFAAQLGQRHHRIAGRTTASAASVQALHMGEQFSTLGCVDQRHVPLAHAHGAQQRIRDFVFGIDQGVANGVEVVMGHGGV
jgi:malonyl CoA-acyl carrier protein transacylase